MEDISPYIVILSLILFAGVALSRFSKYMKIPILICFLAVGAVCGQHGLDLFHSMEIKNVQVFGEIALCFIIFTGGLQTSFQSIRKVFRTGTILATVGVVLTALVAGIFIRWISYMELFVTLNIYDAILIGSIFASTDAAAVFAILRGQKAAINPNLQGLLEYESGSNDPAAFLLVSVMIPIVLATKKVDLFNVSLDIGWGIIWGLGAGSAVGFLIGIFGQWFYNWIQSFLEYNGLRFVAAVAIVLFCCGVVNTGIHANSLMACYIAGITMGNVRFNFRQIYIKFHDGVSWLMQILLFTTLGSFFDYHMLFNFRNVVGAVLASFVLMFIARPLVVMLCMIGSPFTIKERIFASWVGIRGSAPIMLAAMVMANAPPQYSYDVNNLFYGVFTVVLLSILVQGSSIIWVAKKLGLVLPYKEHEENLLEYDERADGREMYRFTISHNNILVGKKIMDSGLTGNPILLMIKRGANFIQPKPDVVLEAGDSLNFLGEQSAMKELHVQFFPDEDYSPSQTFNQLWTELSGIFWERRKRKGK